MKQSIQFFAGVVLTIATGLACQAQTTAFVGATIETADKSGRLENATLVVSDGKIVSVGSDVDAPDNAVIISAQGKTILPGVIDPYFVFQTSPGSETTRTVTFNGRTFTVPVRGGFSVGSFKKVGEYFMADDFDFLPAIRSGMTSANLVSDGRGLSAFADLVADPSPEMLFETEGRLFAKVTNQTAALDVIRKPLKSDDKKTGNQGARTSTTRSRSGGTPDPAKEYWDAVNEGKQPLLVNMNSAAAVAYVLQVARDNPKVKLGLVATGGNLYPLLDQIEKLDNVTVILQPGIDTVPFTRDLMNVSQMLQEREIPFAFSMSLAGAQLKTTQDDPMFPLAVLIRTGLDRDLAIQALTIKPAELLGIEKSRGSIAENKQANFLIFDGDPFSTGSRLEQVYSNGKLIHEN